MKSPPLEHSGCTHPRAAETVCEGRRLLYATATGVSQQHFRRLCSRLCKHDHSSRQQVRMMCACRAEAHVNNPTRMRPRAPFVGWWFFCGRSCSTCVKPRRTWHTRTTLGQLRRSSAHTARVSVSRTINSRPPAPSSSSRHNKHLADTEGPRKSERPFHSFV